MRLHLKVNALSLPLPAAAAGAGGVRGTEERRYWDELSAEGKGLWRKEAARRLLATLLPFALDVALPTAGA